MKKKEQKHIEPLTPFFDDGFVTVFNENCAETLGRLPESSLDLTVTSPPYDDLRTYKGYAFDVEAVAKGLYRATKFGGVVVWVVNDKTKDGDESGTSFEHALTFKQAGFKLWDTMIWRKTNPLPVDGRIPRYVPSFEYMFVFVKDTAPKSFNPVRVPCRKAGTRAVSNNNYPARRENGIKSSERVVSATAAVRLDRIIGNVVELPSNEGGSDKYAIQHPAAFPKALAAFHISSWSSDGDTVYDPFLGSGTTAVVAKKLGRKCIGSEISAEYCELAAKRIETETAMPLFDEMEVAA